MEDRLCLKMALDSLKEIYSSVSAGRRTLAGILERVNTSAEPAGRPSLSSLFASILGRLVVLEKELQGEMREIQHLGVQMSGSATAERFSDERIAQYRRINAEFAAIEKRIGQDFERLLPQCERMQKEGIIDDFEIEAEVSVLLDENDPAYRNDDDNILAVSSFDAKSRANSDFGVGDGQSHNEYRFSDDHPMKDEQHCRLFHDLYDHKKLWDDIVRADMIWLDTRVTYQNFYSLKQKSESERGL